MDPLNFNINEYNDKELEEILSLTYPYQEQDIVNKKNILCSKLVKDNNLSFDSKEKMTIFLNNVGEKLIKLLPSNIKYDDTYDVAKYANTQKNNVQTVNGQFLIKNEEKQKAAINREELDGLHPHSYGAPPGIINPLNYQTIRKTISIDSKFRSNYYNSSASDQQISLPTKIDKVISMGLTNIDIPFTTYAISKENENNKFIVSWDPENPNDENTDYNNNVLIVIPDGNYSSISNSSSPHPFIGEIINNLLNDPNQITLGNSQKITDTSFNLVYTVESSSNKSNFHASNLSTNAFRIMFGIKSINNYNYNYTPNEVTNLINVSKPLPYFLGWMLGYRVNVYTSKLIKNNWSVLSEGLCLITSSSYLFLSIDDYNNNVNNNYVSIYTESINNNNILAKITMNERQSYEEFSGHTNRERRYFGPVGIEKLRITLYDEYGRMANLNNMDWSCELTFECIY